MLQKLVTLTRSNILPERCKSLLALGQVGKDGLKLLIELKFLPVSFGLNFTKNLILGINSCLLSYESFDSLIDKVLNVLMDLWLKHTHDILLNVQDLLANRGSSWLS